MGIIPHNEPYTTYLLGFGTPGLTETCQNACTKSKDGEISSILACHDRPSGINPSMGTPSTIDENELVLRASRRPTQAPILTSLGASSRDRDPSATPTARPAATLAALWTPNLVAFVWYVVDCCVRRQGTCVAGILFPSGLLACYAAAAMVNG